MSELRSTADADAARLSATAQDAFARGDFAAAERASTALTTAAPGVPDGWRLLARVALVRGDPRAALATLRTGVARTHEDPALVGDLAELSLQTGDVATALTLAERLRAAAPNDVERIDRCARARWRLGLFGAAVGDFERVAALAPASSGARLALARAYINVGRRADAEALLEAAVAAGDDAARSLLAFCRHDPDDIARSRATFEAALTAAPGDRAARLGTAIVRALDGDMNGAQQLIATLAGDANALALWEGFDALRAAGCTRFLGVSLDVLHEALAAAREPGYSAEFGVFTGRTLRIIAAAHAADVHGFDTFTGLPEDWSARMPQGTYSAGGRLPEDLPEHVALHVGRFDATLPGFAASAGRARFWHVDCDMYSSTRSILDTLGATLVPGSVVVFDDFVGYPGWRDHEWRAWHEFATARGVRYRWICASLAGREAALVVTE